MSDLEDRLRSWFAAEVGRAEEDLATGRVTTVRRRARTPAPGLLVVGVVAALVVVVVALRPTVAPDAGLGPDGSPWSTPAAGGDTVFGRNGIPTIVDGEPVLTPAEAVIHARNATTDGPFLVGGWYRIWPTGFGCLPSSGTETDWRALLPKPGCSIAAIHAGEIGEAERDAGLDAIAAGTALEVRAGDSERGALVARVHVHDPRAADCPPNRRATCESAVIIDKVVWRPPTYANGIPRAIDDEPVLLMDVAYNTLTGPDFPQRMLVGGWYVDNPVPCPSQPGRPVSPLIASCGAAQLSEIAEPGGLRLDVIPDGKNIPRGRVVLRVHTGDPRASACPESVRQPCERAIVVEEVAWSEPFEAIGP